MEIRDQMRMLLEALGKHDAVTRDLLIEHSDLIRAISKKCQSSGLYLDFEPRIRQVAQKIEADHKADDRLMYVWNWCMQLIVSARSQFQRDGAIILTIPLVAKYLPETTELEKPEAIIINLDLDYRAPEGSKHCVSWSASGGHGLAAQPARPRMSKARFSIGMRRLSM